MASRAWMRADDAGQHAQHAGLGARRGQLGGRRLGHHVAVGGPATGIEHGDHAVEAEDRAVHHRDAQLHRGVVDQVAGGEVVGAVDHQVVALEDGHHVVGAQAHVVGDHVDVGVEGGERLLGRVDLALADAVDVVQDLALQVRVVDHVHVDDADGADPGRGQVQGGRRAEPAGAQQQHLGVEQLELALLADLGQQQVALVAVALLGAEGARRLPLAALVLPLVEAAGHRDHVGVAELGQRLGREGRAHAAGAVARPGGCRGRGRGPRCWTRGGPGGCAAPPGMAPCSNSSGSRTSSTTVPGACAQLVGGGGVDLADLGFGLLEQVSEGGHLYLCSVPAAPKGYRTGQQSSQAVIPAPRRCGQDLADRAPQDDPSARSSISVGSALTMTTGAPRRAASGHHGGHRVDAEGRADGQQQVAGRRPPRRPGPGRPRPGSGRRRWWPT